MKVNINYKGKSVELDIPDEKLEELVNEPKKTGWEKPNKGEVYCYLQRDSELYKAHWANDDFDNTTYECGNCFTSKELAENIARYQSLDLRIRRRIAEICEPIDWNTYGNRYSIVYNHAMKELDWFESWHGEYAIWYCDTAEHAKQIIEEFKDDLTWFFTEFKDRMDG